jgi:alpha-beta hydrolase superfamily lysophospholipase
MSTFTSRDGTVLHEAIWNVAGGQPRGAVVLQHGYGEHIGRYDHVGKALAARGFVTRGSDLRGHGQSSGARGHCNRFSDYLDDLAALIARAPERPLFLVAHSFGALVSTEYLLQRGSDGISGIMLSSPYYGLKLKVSPIKVALAKLTSNLVPKLSMPNGLKGSDATRDAELAKTYDSDPLNSKVATARWFTEQMQAQADVSARASEVKLPLLMMQGGADRLADAAVSKQVFAKFSSVDKTLQYLEGQFHEVFNEPGDVKTKNLDALCDWLESHAS